MHMFLLCIYTVERKYLVYMMIAIKHKNEQCQKMNTIQTVLEIFFCLQRFYKYIILSL